MSNARKLQTEIDRVMKKVDEGVDLFDEIWEKVYSAEQQNQKEKYEMDLKREIKKLQRLRDQIKTWVGSSDVKDKDPLLDARKLIETKMEQFKICEKETKTKTYSKEGLARAEKLDPAEEAKRNTITWISEYISRFNQNVEDREVEIERLTSGKGKKTNKHIIEEYNHYIAEHKFHVNKLEGIMRLVNNDVLDVEAVESIKEDLDYYLESYEDPDYQQGYDEEFFYEALGLDELDVVNVDRVTTVVPTKKKDDDAASSSTRGSRDRKSSKKSALSSVIPLTIGRARASSSKDKDKEETKSTPSKASRSSSTGSAASGPMPTTIPAARSTPTPNGGASMAAILKRETEQQEKERQKIRAAQAQAEQRQQQQKQAEQARQDAIQRQKEVAAKQEALQKEAAAKQEVLQQKQKEAAAKQEALQRMQERQQEAIRLQEMQEAQQKAAEKNQMSQSRPSSGSVASGSVDGLSAGMSGISLGGDTAVSQHSGPTANLSTTTTGAVAESPAHRVGASGVGLGLGNSGMSLAALDESFATMPNASDNERSRQYTPQNPYPTPASYPAVPSAIFENPAVFGKLGTDCLFFIFYYAQGTYQQYLAARELKKQSWRFHKKYMTWFQRHKEPDVTTDEYEQGTYVYFDYETGWCTRIKTDFRFEYSFLEDSLA